MVILRKIRDANPHIKKCLARNENFGVVCFNFKGHKDAHRFQITIEW